MKRKKGLIIGLGLLFAFIVGVAALGSDTSEQVAKNNAEVKEEEDSAESKEEVNEGKEDNNKEAVKEDINFEQEPVEENVVSSVNTELDAILPGDKDYNEYLHDGEIYDSTDGTLTMEIVGISYRYGEIGSPSVTIAILAEFTNNSDTDMYFSQYDATTYIDDYEYDGNRDMYQNLGSVIYPGDGNYYLTSATANAGGRKCTVCFMTSIFSEKVTESSKIEFEICGMSFVINPLLILGRFKEDEPEEETELIDISHAVIHDGQYVCAESNVVIYIIGNLMTVQYSEGYDFVEQPLNENEDGSYSLEYNGEIYTLDFYGETGISVSGPIGGWYVEIR